MPRYGRTQMGWVVALVAIIALVMLGFILSRAEVEKDWRDQANGLRQRLAHDGVPSAAYEDDRDAGHAYDRLNL
jgi:hypothetical protein